MDVAAKMGKTVSKAKPKQDHGDLQALNDPIIKQWIDKVTKFSSQYDTEKWNADETIGPPKVYPAYGDIAGLWAPQENDSNQFIEVEFDEAVFVTKIDIYETYHAGGIKAIKALDGLGKWQTLYSTDAVVSIKHSRVFTPELQELDFMIKNIRIEVDCSACDTWVELDAVQLHGSRFRLDPPPSFEVLADDIGRLINNQTFSDVEFIVEGKTFYGHKSIISMRSNYFRDLFSNNMKDTTDPRVELPDIPYDIFKAVISYIYTNKIQDAFTLIQLTDICQAAYRYGIEGLKLLTTFKIGAQIDEDNVVDVYVSASSKLPALYGIKNSCMSYMASNMAKVVYTPSFMRLPQITKLEILNKDKTQSGNNTFEI